MVEIHTDTGSTGRWESLEQWSPTAFLVAGAALFGGFFLRAGELIAVGEQFQAVPEWFFAIFTLIGVIAVSIGLIGFYPYVADRSPWLALGGVIAAAIGGLSIVLAVGGSIVLDLLGILAFTAGEGNPVLLALFFLFIIGLLLSFLLYGIASVRTRSPSLVIGALLLVPIVEPIAVIFFDLLAVVNVGAAGLLATSAIYSVSLLAIGYFLRTVTSEPGRPTQAADVR